MKRYYKIGNFSFAIQSEHGLHMPAHFSLFETDKAKTDIVYTIQIVNQLPEITGRTVHSSNDIVITDDGGFESRQLSVVGTDRPYAVYKELDNNNIQIFLEAASADEVLAYDTTFTAMFALEKSMLERNNLILHSCSVTYNSDEAILFSAPSGTGKSTQGELWRKYRNSRVINGDRNLLTKKDNRWYMQGWPVCGSSEICHNEEHPIRAIIMLEQAAEDHISKLDGMKAYAKIYPEITCNRWDRKRLIRTMDLIETLISEVPVYLLKCTISERAVEILDDVLSERE